MTDEAKPLSGEERANVLRMAEGSSNRAILILRDLAVKTDFCEYCNEAEAHVEALMRRVLRYEATVRELEARLGRAMTALDRYAPEVYDEIQNDEGADHEA